MITERPLTRERRLAEEAIRRMLEDNLKFVIYHRNADDRHAPTRLEDKEIFEIVTYNGKEYKIHTKITDDDISHIKLQTAKIS